MEKNMDNETETAFRDFGGFISLTHLNDLKIVEYQNFPGYRLSRAMQDFSEVRGNNI